MNQICTVGAPSSENSDARDWVQLLAKYRSPNIGRSMFELSVSMVAFVALWAIASKISAHHIL